MTLPARGPNPWLQVTKRLARDVAVQDYIFDIDAPRRGGGNNPRPRRLAQAAVLVVGMVAGPAILWLCGLRAATPAQLRLAETVLSVDPRAGRWADEKLRARLEFRREAISLIEHTLATPSGSTYPYLSVLSGHPSPNIDPGTAPALLMLANALDRFPAGQRGHYVQAIVAAALALSDPDLQHLFVVLGKLPPEKRHRLVADSAAGLKHMLAEELAFQDDTSERDHLNTELASERLALAVEIKALAAALDTVRRRRQELSDADRRCGEVYRSYRVCLAKAAREQSPP